MSALNIIYYLDSRIKAR